MMVLFQRLLLVLAQFGQDELVKQIEYLKVENEILRSRLPKHIRTTPAERARLLEYGKRLGDAIKELVTIVTPRTFMRWMAEHAGASSNRLTMIDLNAPLACSSSGLDHLSLDCYDHDTQVPIRGSFSVRFVLVLSGFSCHTSVEHRGGTFPFHVIINLCYTARHDVRDVGMACSSTVHVFSGDGLGLDVAPWVDWVSGPGRSLKHVFLLPGDFHG
jgi:hypothetical protein